MGLADQFLDDAGGQPSAQSSPSTTKGGAPMYADIDAKHGYPVGFMAAVARAESNNNPNAVSKKGAQGIFQMMPATQKNPGYGLGPLDPNNPEHAAQYIDAMTKEAGGDLFKGLAMYNAGAKGHLDNPETNNYVKTIKSYIPNLDRQTKTAQSPAPQLGGPTPQVSQLDAPPTATMANAPTGLAASFLADAGPAKGEAAKTAQAPAAQGQSLASGTDIKNAALTTINSLNPMTQAKTAGETALQMGTGAVASAVGGVKGLYDLATGKGVDAAAQNIRDIQQKYTYQPRSQSAQGFTQGMGEATGAANTAIGNAAAGTVGALGGGQNVQEAARSIGQVALPIAGTLAGGASALRNAPTLSGMGKMPSMEEIRTAVNANNPVSPAAAGTDVAAVKPRYKLNSDGSMTPIQTGNAISPSSPMTQKIQETRTQLQETNAHLKPEQLTRHSEAQALPVPVQITDAQASGNPALISQEMNSRGKFPQIAQTLNDQNAALIGNFDAIRNKVAPNIQGVTTTDIGQGLVDAYKAKDEVLRQGITDKYQALEDANGGQFPVDGGKFVNSADKALEQKNVTRFLPTPVQGILNELRGTGAMTFNTFENYRTILAQQGRLAARSGDGTAEYAIGLVRNSLENLPLTEETAAIKPLADAARAAAKQRFDLIKADPAYKAATSEDAPLGAPSPLADSFVKNYIVSGKTANVKNMMDNLGHNPLAKEAISAGLMDHLKAASGIDLRTGAGNVTQAGLNKAIQASGNKLPLILGDEADTVNVLGNVAKYTQEQPRGSFVNNSNTFVGSLGGLAKQGAETALNIKTLGGYGVAKSIVQNVMQNNKKPSVVMMKDMVKK